MSDKNFSIKGCDIKDSPVNIGLITATTSDLEEFRTKLIQKLNRDRDRLTSRSFLFDASHIDYKNSETVGRFIRAIEESGVRVSGVTVLDAKEKLSREVESSLNSEFGLASLSRPVTQKQPGPSQVTLAKEAVSSVKSNELKENNAAPTETAKDPSKMTMYVNQLVRGGDEVLAKNKNLMLVAGINQNAKAFADGNVTVIGNASGSVYAGHSGDCDSHILLMKCNVNEVGIANIRYLIDEEMLEVLKDKKVMFYLNEERDGVIARVL